MCLKSRLQYGRPATTSSDTCRWRFARVLYGGMNTETSLEIICIDSTATERLGSNIGARLKGGEVFELY